MDKENTVTELSTQNPNNYQSTSFHYLKITLTYLYHLGISPFKIVEIESGGFVLHTNKVQKVSNTAHF